MKALIVLNPYSSIVRNCAYVAYDVTWMFSYLYKLNLYFHFPANTNVGLEICSTENSLSMLHAWLMTCGLETGEFSFFQRHIEIPLWARVAKQFFLSNYIFWLSGHQSITNRWKNKTKSVKSPICVYIRWKNKCTRNCAHSLIIMLPCLFVSLILCFYILP